MKETLIQCLECGWVGTNNQTLRKVEQVNCVDGKAFTLIKVCPLCGENHMRKFYKPIYTFGVN